MSAMLGLQKSSPPPIFQMNNVKLLINKIRIWFLKLFTNRVKQIDITDSKGRHHRVTVERKEETVCEHKVLRQVHHILWKCQNPACELGAYFFIPSKILVAKPELYGFLDDLADHLGEELHEKGTVKQNGNGVASD